MNIIKILIIFLFLTIPLISFAKNNGKNIYLKKCTQCHKTDIIESRQGMSKKKWKNIIKTMKRYGLSINKKEQRDILFYLTKGLKKPTNKEKSK